MWSWQCLECGHLFKTQKAAERATFSDKGCPGCGGSDIDYASVFRFKIGEWVKGTPAMQERHTLGGKYEIISRGHAGAVNVYTLRDLAMPSYHRLNATEKCLEKTS